MTRVIVGHVGCNGEWIRKEGVATTTISILVGIPSGCLPPPAPCFGLLDYSDIIDYWYRSALGRSSNISDIILIQIILLLFAEHNSI